MKKLCLLLGGASLIAFASAANAQPTELSNKQLDSVTAGASALANGAALALGDFDAFTQTITATNSVTSAKLANGTYQPGFAIGQAYTAAAAASALFQAAVAVSASSAAQLP